MRTSLWLPPELTREPTTKILTSRDIISNCAAVPEQKRQFIMNIPAEAENTLEEFAWAFGEDTVNEIERRVHIVLEHIHQMPDLEQLAEQGIEELMETWHTLGAIDEDEFLRRMELHMDELPEHMTEEHNRRVVLELIEKRRRHIARQLQQDNPEILEKLKASRVKLEKRLEKQQPEAAKRLSNTLNEIRDATAIQSPKCN